jgi:hypothetical protein
MSGAQSPAYRAELQFYRKHFADQNPRFSTTQPPNPQGELFMSDTTSLAATVALGVAAVEATNAAEQKQAQAEDNKQKADFWDRTAQAGVIADKEHQQTQTESQQPEKAKAQQP